MSQSLSRLWLPVIAVCGLLSACVSLPDRNDRLAVHTLHAASPDTVATQSAQTLRIDLPNAAPPLDGTRVCGLPPSQRRRPGARVTSPSRSLAR